MIKLKTILRKNKNGFIPAVLYGEGLKNVNLSVAEKDFEKAFAEAGETTLIELEFNGKKEEVLIHQLSRDPLSGKVIHIDFFKPSMKKKITSEVPIVFEGESTAVTEMGGILVREIQEVPVRGLAKDLPREIEVNLEVLRSFEDKVVVKDLEVPEGVEILNHNPDDLVCHVEEPKEEEVIEEEEEKEEEAEVEQEGEEKQATEQEKEE